MCVYVYSLLFSYAKIKNRQRASLIRLSGHHIDHDRSMQCRVQIMMQIIKVKCGSTHCSGYRRCAELLPWLLHGLAHPQKWDVESYRTERSHMHQSRSRDTILIQKPLDRVFLISHFSAWCSPRAMQIVSSGSHRLAGSDDTKLLASLCAPNPGRGMNNSRPGAPLSGSIWCDRENGRKRESKSGNTFWCATWHPRGVESAR